MKRSLLFFLTTFTSITVFAQDARSLIKDGTALSNSGHYAEAIDKFKTALTAEPDNVSVNYQLAYALNALGKSVAALPYLQKAIKAGASPSIMSSAYALMGSIYDQAGQPQKAIESYRNGLTIDSASQSLYYNLGLAYFRNKQYAEAEQSAISSLKLDPAHAASMRLYALVAFHQNKRAAALLGLCSFLWLEPNGPHAAEANDNIQHILQGGALKPDPGMKSHAINADVYSYNQAISNAVAAVAKRRYFAAADQFTEQLTAIFTTVGELADKHPANDLFHQQARFYYRLAQSGNMPAFVRYIKQHIDPASAAWLTEHPDKVTALQGWVKADITTR